MKQLKRNVILVSTLTVLLTACSGVGSDSFNDGGGGDNSLNIQSIATISSSLNSDYYSNCIYYSGYSINLVKIDGSGNGYALNTSNGRVTPVSRLPSINLANGDQCLTNYQSLTWVNSANPYIVNIYNAGANTTTAVDLSNAGLLGSEILSTSFVLSGSGSTLYANNNFLNNDTFGFTSFILPNPTTYTEITNSLYANRSNTNVLYGFTGSGNQFMQLFRANTLLNQPAAIANIQISNGIMAQNLSTITDTNNQIIPAMMSIWDYTPAGKGVVVTTGALQPVLYKCPLVAANQYQCDKSYTGTELTNRYRIMRLLGGNANQVYFLGIDLVKADIEIFSLQL